MGSTLVAQTAPAGAIAPTLILSEVMYHAADGTTAEDDDYDYIELTNVGATAVNLQNWSITTAIDFTATSSLVVPAGGFVVIAHDAAAFAERYGTPPDATFDGGKLKNSSEFIELRDPTGMVVDVLQYNDDPPWPGAADGGGRSLERFDLTTTNQGDDTDVANWFPSPDIYGTPGAANGVLTSGPLIANVDDGDQRPPAGTGIPVSATITAADSVQITYRVGFGSMSTMPMLDDAASAGGAGDGTYTAVLPGQPGRSLVRYRVTATNTNGSSTSPADTDTIDRHGIVVADPSAPTDIPVLDWFIEESDYITLLGPAKYTDATYPIVVSYGDQVVDNATIRVRGGITRSRAKPSMKIELPPGYLIDFGAELDEPVDEFNLLFRADMRADVGWDIAEELGLQSVDLFPMRVYRNSNFWGTGSYLTATDGRYRDRVGYDDAAIYKADDWMEIGPTPASIADQWEKKEGDPTDFSDMWEFTNEVLAPQSQAQFESMMEIMDVPAVINYWAYTNFLRQVDDGFHNHFWVSDPEGTGRWHVDLWDLEFNHGGGPATIWNSVMPAIKKLMVYPEFRAMHDRRMKTMIDSYSAQELIDRYDAVHNVAAPAYQDDRALWGQTRDAEAARTIWVDGVTARYNLYSSVTAPVGTLLPPPQSAAWPIEISAINAASGVMPARVELTNTSTSESFDLSGWTLDPIGLIIPAGTVLLPGSTVVFSDDDVALRDATVGLFAAGEFSPLAVDGVMMLSDADGQPIDSRPWGDSDRLALLPQPCVVQSGGLTPSGGPMSVQITGTCGVPAAGVAAVVVSVASINAAGSGNLKVSAAGTVPQGGVVNYAANSLHNTNTITVPVSAGGAIDVAANGSAVDYSVTVIGYHAPAGALTYTPLSPCAVADSRPTQGAAAPHIGPFGAGDSYPDIDVVGTFPAAQGGSNTDCGVPANADAVVVNVIAVGGTGGQGGLAVGTGGTEPAVATTFYSDIGLNNAASMTIPLGGGETIAANIVAMAGAPTSHVRIVVLGYYATNAGSDYTPTNPCAVFDTRFGTAAFGGVRSHDTPTTFQITGTPPTDQGGVAIGCGVPVGAEAVLINLVAIQADSAGNFQAYSTGGSASGGVVNFADLSPSMNNSNAVVIPLSGLGQLDLNVNAPAGGGTTHARGVILGYYS